MTHPIFALDPEGYQAHALHHHEQAWRESNCYLDVWIEVLHALGLDVEAGLAFPLASTFEHDQWTFFKPPHTDLWELYGVEVEELTLWLPLLEHAQNQVRAGRLPLVEMDAYYLPDTAGSDYRSAHVKTTIAITAVDPAARRLRYFHNAGFHRLEGEDFDGIFRLGRPEHEDYLPPYCEIVKVDRARRLEPVALRALSLRLAAEHFARRPAENPIRAYAARVPEHLDLVLSRGEQGVDLVARQLHQARQHAFHRPGPQLVLAQGAVDVLGVDEAGELVEGDLGPRDHRARPGGQRLGVQLLG